jgi:hypothetical protein
VTVLRAWPTEIESDLSRYHRRDIGEWWNGALSSRKLWAFIVHLPDDSATKTAMREGDWSEAQYIDARLVNELASFRADHAAVHAKQKMRPTLLESPGQRRSAEDRRRRYLEVREDLLNQMSGGTHTPASDLQTDGGG